MFKFLLVIIMLTSSLLYAKAQDTKLLEYKVGQLIKEKDVLKSQVQDLIKDNETFKLKINTIKENYQNEAENNRNLYDKQLTTFQVILGVVGALFLLVTFLGINNIKGYVVKLIDGKTNDKIKELEKTIKEYKDLLEKIKIKTEKEVEDFINTMSEDIVNQTKEFSVEEKELLQKLSEEVKNKQDKTENDWYVLAMRYTNQNDYKNAANAYNKVIELNPKNIVAYNNLGYVYGKLDEDEKAIKVYEEALIINPNYVQVIVNLGISYGKINEYEKAISCYKKVPENHEQYKQSFLNLYELSIITNITIDEGLVSKFLEKYASNKEEMIKYDMLEIIKDIKNNKDITNKLQNWKDKYKSVSLKGWGFKELESLINSEDNPKIKSHLQNALEIFKLHPQD
ncbi:tetratricopeptide repeat protein [Sulfurimonas sp.]|uniref:tetratricopeptide repeat protein n=1 Tax=Sulfurimonas sp. TaxID=2022749 RepID=UPI003566ADF6